MVKTPNKQSKDSNKKQQVFGTSKRKTMNNLKVFAVSKDIPLKANKHHPISFMSICQGAFPTYAANTY